MFGSFSDHITFIDPDSGLLTETKYYNERYGFSDSEPFYLTDKDMYGISLFDRLDDPRIINGFTSDSLVSIHIKHKDESYIRVFQRYYDQYFNLFFDLSNDVKNMGSLKNFNNPVEHSIVSLE
jgi:hypothetical protein